MNPVICELIAETDALKCRLTVAATLERQLVARVAELEAALGYTLGYEGNAHGAPDHSHGRPGRWDSNGAPCADCAAWEKARTTLNRDAQEPR